MLQEEKSILLQDLCGRLPYNTIVSIAEGGVDGIKWNKVVLNIHLLYQIEEEGSWEFVKPYLRPISSITKEEISDLQKINSQFCFDKFDNFAYVGAADDGFCSVEEMDKILNYLNSKHLDYRGLLSMNLALEAPDGMYN